VLQLIQAYSVRTLLIFIADKAAKKQTYNT